MFLAEPICSRDASVRVMGSEIFYLLLNEITRIHLQHNWDIGNTLLRGVMCCSVGYRCLQQTVLGVAHTSDTHVI